MSYQTLEVWQKAMDLVERVYILTKSFPGDELYNLTSQMKRSALSIPCNIAEGKGRASNREYRQFLFRARGSLFELETQVQLAGRLRLTDLESASSLLGSVGEVGRLLGGLIRFVEGQLDSDRLSMVRTRLQKLPKPKTQNPEPEA